MDAGPSPSNPTWLVPVVVSEWRLREPGALLDAVQAARIERGFTPDGVDHPRRHWLVVGLLPAGVIDAVAVAGWWATGSIIAVITVAGLTAAIAGAFALVQRDPLRINRTRRRQLNGTHVWRSRNNWIPPASGTRERDQLDRAQQAVRRIVRTRAWQLPGTADVRSDLDLITELDEVDAQAFRLATLGSTGPDHAQLQHLLRQRVQAIAALADELERQDRGSAGAVAPEDAPSSDSIAGGVLDEYATQRLQALTRAVREAGGS
jgi:hypothetical protein